MIQLNLLPDIKKEYIKARKTKALVVVVSILTTIGAIGLSALMFLYVTFVQPLQLGIVTDDIKKQSNTLNNISDLAKYLTIQNQLAALPALHDQKGAYDRLFDILPILNPSSPNNIKLASLQLMAVDSSLTLTGTTTTFESLNIFVDTLKNAQINYQVKGDTSPRQDKVFDTVLVQNSDLSRVNGALVVSFTIKTTYKEPVFNILNSGVNVSIPSISTSQSVTGSPKLNPFQTTKPGGQ